MRKNCIIANDANAVLHISIWTNPNCDRSGTGTIKVNRLPLPPSWKPERKMLPRLMPVVISALKLKRVLN